MHYRDKIRDGFRLFREGLAELQASGPEGAEEASSLIASAISGAAASSFGYGDTTLAGLEATLENFGAAQCADDDETPGAA